MSRMRSSRTAAGYTRMADGAGHRDRFTMWAQVDKCRGGFRGAGGLAQICIWITEMDQWMELMMRKASGR